MLFSFGFHTGSGGTGVPKSFYDVLATTDIQIVAKSADVYPIDAQNVAKAGAKSFIVYRQSQINGQSADVPDYMLDPTEAARRHWQWHKDNLPKEFDPAVCWLETMNEIAKHLDYPTRAGAEKIPLHGVRQIEKINDNLWRIYNEGWLGAFAYETARLALADGIKWLAFGWATGEPEPQQWAHPEMLKFLTLASQNRNRLGVAVHEYSLDTNNILAGDGWLVGRFKHLVNICRQNGIEEPTIFISEFGWNAHDVPSEKTAVKHLDQAANIYLPYPTVTGAAIWYLGGGFNNIHKKASKLIEPVQAWLLQNRERLSRQDIVDPVPPPPPPPAPPQPKDGQPRVQYRRVYWLVPDFVPDEERARIYRQAAIENVTVGPSADDAGIGNLKDKTVIVFGWPKQEQVALREWYKVHYPGTKVFFRDIFTGEPVS
ncbi:MAG: hypothetical protein D6706_14905, partial [Chloroflexi bacterium]